MRPRLRFSIFTFLLLLLSAVAVRAQNPAPPASNAPLTIRESVVVTATGREVPESKVGASITSLDSEDIEQRHALSTIDLLRTVPGVVAVRTGGVGNLTGVFVRGGESTYNKVLLDGMPLNEPARDVDPCGERGEYHTIVTSCPAFREPLRVRALGRATNSGCVAEDLVLDE